MVHSTFITKVVLQTLDSGHCLATAFHYPEVSSCGSDAREALVVLRQRLRCLLQEEDRYALHQRQFDDTPTLQRMPWDVTPTRRSLAWREPARLRFDVWSWPSGVENRCEAWVPALGLQVQARNPTELERRVRDEIRFALDRRRVTRGLRPLAELQRCQETRLLPFTVKVRLETPRERAQGEGNSRHSQEQAVLRSVATDLTTLHPRPLFERETLVSRLAEQLNGPSPRSVLLIGPSGVGKTALVQELVRCRAAMGFGHTPFWATSGSRLVAGMAGFGEWQARCLTLARALKSHLAILHLGQLLELREAGQAEGQPQGVAAFLQPYLSRGDWLAVAECTPEQLTFIEKNDPHLLEAFSRLEIEEPTPEQGRRILDQSAAWATRQGRGEINAAGLDVMDRLHRRYAAYSAYPGRPLQFLERLLEPTQSPVGPRRVPAVGAALGPEPVIAAFSRETGLPRFLLDEDQAMDVEGVRDFFTKRVIGQPIAVDTLVDVIAAAKARLARPEKPLASLLFLGPTGVGKTEMAKAIAEFFFGQSRRLIRFDMGEYADPPAAERLIGTAHREGLLTAKVREQPFCVVLLDEFEKADSAVFDLLLQVLGEGRLTDVRGRLANFRNAVIVMTSNLGSETFQRGALGFGGTTGSASDARDHFTDAVRRFLRPELFNRLDHLIPFAPLDPVALREIAHRELDRVKGRDGVLRRRLDLDLPEAVVQHLAERGFDPRYGARPLKRVIERELLLPLAEAMNAYPEDLALRAEVGLRKGRINVRVRSQETAAGTPIRTNASESSLAGLARRAVDLRRELRRFHQIRFVQELQSDVQYLTALERRRRARQLSRGWAPITEPQTQVGLRKLPLMKDALEDLATLRREAEAGETAVLLSLYSRSPDQEGFNEASVMGLESQRQALQRRFFGLNFEDPHHITLGLLGKDLPWIGRLATGYLALARRWGLEVRVAALKPPAQNAAPGTAPTRVPAASHTRVETFLQAPPPESLGILIGMIGDLAWARLVDERGLHTLRQNASEHRCTVDTQNVVLAHYQVPSATDRRFSRRTRGRLYDVDREALKDPVQGSSPLDERRLPDALEEMIDRRLAKGMEALFTA